MIHVVVVLLSFAVGSAGGFLAAWVAVRRDRKGPLLLTRSQIVDTPS